MKTNSILLLTILISTISFCQKIETVYLDKKDSTANMYIAVVPQSGQINSFMFLLDGFGNYSPKDLLIETDLPKIRSTTKYFNHHTNTTNSINSFRDCCDAMSLPKYKAPVFNILENKLLKTYHSIYGCLPKWNNEF